MKIGIIGAGAWGTALAIVVARGGADVTLWSFDGKMCEFDGVKIPANLNKTCDLAGISDCDAWLVVTPAAFCRETLQRAREFYHDQPIIICTKGAEPDTGDFMSTVLKQTIPECRHFGVLSGPQFAAETARGTPTGSTLAGDALTCAIGRQIFNKLFISETDDVIGAEICGVGKNAVALICGYVSVAGRGENERAMVLTRAWGEVVNIGRAMGARADTFLDLCGIGDLFLSATSVTSRNFSGGVTLAGGRAPDGTVEGISALRGLIHRAEQLGVDVPVLCEMKQRMKI